MGRQRELTETRFATLVKGRYLAKGLRRFGARVVA
jgi:hypothetical protein